jgi:tetratricopeptide (TPR) repeat protein
MVKSIERQKPCFEDRIKEEDVMSQVSGSGWRTSPAHLFFLANLLEPKRVDDLPRCLDWERLLGSSPTEAVQELLDLGALELEGTGKPLAERMTQFHVTTLKEMLRARDSSLTGNKEELIARLIELDPQAMEEALGEVSAYCCSQGARTAIEEYLRRAAQTPVQENQPRNIPADGPAGTQAPARNEALKPARAAVTPDGSTAADHLRRAAEHGLSGDYERASDEYRQAIEVDPSSAAAYYGQGLIHERQGDYRSALDDYHRAVSLDAHQALYLTGRGAAYRKMGHPDLAIADYDRALSLDPTLAAAYHNRGVAYEHLGDYRRALDDYNRAIEMDARAALSFLGRGIACQHLGDAASAAAAYEAVVQLSTDPQIRSWAEARLRRLTQGAGCKMQDAGCLAADE